MQADPLPQAGAEIDGFKLLGKIHEGGMALIYRVSKTGIDLPMIMKIPKLGFGSHPACYVGFDVEQMIMEKVSGPHVPAYIAKGDMAQQPYLVMEYVAGPSLHDSVDRGPANLEQIAQQGKALADALHDLHRQDVVHLDIKPDNVLFRPNGTAVVIDFGLARHAHLPDLIEEAFQKPLGNSAYISPEQVLNNRCDPRSDIFALGVILYQLATGHLPFGEPTTISGFRRRLYIDPVPPRAIRADLPPWLQEIILHCLEVRAAHRYASAAQVAFDLVHQEQVVLSARAQRLKRAGLGKVLQRWYQSWTMTAKPCAEPAQHLSSAPHTMVALDIPHADEKLLQALRELVRRAITADAHCRITCCTVEAPSILTEEDPAHELANSLHTQRLIEMHHWAQPLALSSEKIRFQVLDGSDPADALLAFARTHHVDLIIIGARGSSMLRRILGSVSAKVAAGAVCNVTVVRVPRARENERSGVAT
jgi:eukaryotic-like serine/threonine-protein kinase